MPMNPPVWMACASDPRSTTYWGHLDNEYNIW